MAEDVAAGDVGGVRHRMTAKGAVRLLASLEAHAVGFCVGGGWGVDALLGRQTREHADLDLWLPAADLGKLLSALAAAGVDRVFPWPGDRPWNFVLHDGGSRRVDLHLYERLPDGSLHYGSVVDGHRVEAEALTGRGVIAGVAVPCEHPRWALEWHTGYPARDVDRHDVPLLAERFGLPLPEAFR